MSTVTSKDFASTYGIDFLPYSMADIQLGEVLSEKGLFNKTLAYLNLPLSTYDN